MLCTRQTYRSVHHAGLSTLVPVLLPLQEEAARLFWRTVSEAGSCGVWHVKCHVALRLAHGRLQLLQATGGERRTNADRKS